MCVCVFFIVFRIAWFDVYVCAFNIVNILQPNRNFRNVHRTKHMCFKIGSIFFFFFFFYLRLVVRRMLTIFAEQLCKKNKTKSNGITWKLCFHNGVSSAVAIGVALVLSCARIQKSARFFFLLSHRFNSISLHVMIYLLVLDSFIFVLVAGFFFFFSLSNCIKNDRVNAILLFNWIACCK